MYEEKEKRFRIKCLTRDKEKVLKNIEKYDFLKIVRIYKKNDKENIIVDSGKNIDYKFVKKFNKQIDKCLGAFECYEKHLD